MPGPLARGDHSRVPDRRPRPAGPGRRPVARRPESTRARTARRMNAWIKLRPAISCRQMRRRHLRAERTPTTTMPANLAIEAVRPPENRSNIPKSVANDGHADRNVQDGAESADVEEALMQRRPLWVRPNPRHAEDEYRNPEGVKEQPQDHGV